MTDFSTFFWSIGGLLASWIYSRQSSSPISGQISYPLVTAGLSPSLDPDIPNAVNNQFTAPLIFDTVPEVDTFDQDSWDKNLANLAAFLAIIRQIESGSQYNVISGGGKFDDFSEHPFILNPNRPKPGGSTASGAYQIVVGTWRSARDALGLPDFTPDSQDAAAQWIIAIKNSAMPDVLNGNFASAVSLLRREWTALSSFSLDDLASAYNTAGGSFA